MFETAKSTMQCERFRGLLKISKPCRLGASIAAIFIFFFFVTLYWNITKRTYGHPVLGQRRVENRSRLNGSVLPVEAVCEKKSEVSRINIALQPSLLVLRNTFKKQLDKDMSKLYMIARKPFYKVGDAIQLRIDLYNEDGKARTTGGDQLKVRIFEDELDAAAMGHVTDHQNGSYTATVKRLWSGTPTIHVFLSRTTEIVSALDTLMSKVPTIWPTYVIYQNGEEARCHPDEAWLIGPRPVCNMTKQNGGIPWFCHAPRETSCDDVRQFKHCNSDVPSYLRRTLNSSQGVVKPSFTVTVRGKPPNDVTSPSKVPCSLYNRTKLWTLPSPVGYFFKNKWTLLHCTPPSPKTFKQCLQDKHIVVYGDSTVRQWFVELKERFRCKLTSEPWECEKWIQDSTAYCPVNNLTLDLVFHSLPGNIEDGKVEFNSIASHILKFYKRKETIFLIGIKLHLHAYHLDLYRDRLRRIRESVDVILDGDPDAKVLVKGGHACWSMFNYERNFRRTLAEHYKGIQDKVVYLDNLDLTMTKLIKAAHPPPLVITAMVNQMLGYICS